MRLTEATELISNALKVHGPMTARQMATAIGLSAKSTASLVSRVRLAHKSLIFVHGKEGLAYGRSINIYAVALDAPEKKTREKLSTHRVRPPLPNNCNVLGIWTQLIHPYERRSFSDQHATH